MPQISDLKFKKADLTADATQAITDLGSAQRALDSSLRDGESPSLVSLARSHIEYLNTKIDSIKANIKAIDNEIISLGGDPALDVPAPIDTIDYKGTPIPPRLVQSESEKSSANTIANPPIPIVSNDNPTDARLQAGTPAAPAAPVATTGMGNMNSASLAPNADGSNLATAIPAGVRAGGAGTTTVSPGAAPNTVAPAGTQFPGSRPDNRVRIKVPPSYQTTYTNAGKVQRGIIFPYTPQIGIEYKADYSSQNPMHSNYTINFYKSSSISDISIQGIFTVQNDNDAMALLSTIHLLRALTKGRFGFTDPLRGAPPPICRLMAYGNYMLDNAPIVIHTFKQDLPSDVDYYHLYANGAVNPFGETMVPIKSTISIVCKLMYSRAEMLTATVPSWFGGASRKKGFL